jgi:hypothetical protein
VLEIRRLAAEKSAEDFPKQIRNEDENLVSNTRDQNGQPVSIPYFAAFSKALSKNERGEVVETAYNDYLQALDLPQDETKTDVFQNIEKLAAGDPSALGTKKGLKLTNPLGGRAYDLEGFDTRAVTIPPAPSFDSETTAAEMAELYWMAVLRDTPFQVFDGLQNGDFRRQFVEWAIDDLKRYSLFSRNIDEKTLFRADLRTLVKQDGTPYFTDQGFEGVSDGPFVSQFLLRGTNEPNFAVPQDGIVALGTYRLNQRQRTVVKNVDFLQNIMDWRRVQNGDRSPIGTDVFDPVRRFIRSSRDIANYVHFDKIYQEYLIAACILLPLIPKTGQRLFSSDERGEMLKSEVDTALTEFEKSGLFTPQVTQPTPAILNPGNPYRYATAHAGFATFGITQITTLLAEVSTRAHKAIFYQKWYVHRRLRPEEFGGRVHFHLMSPFPLYVKADSTPFIHQLLLDDVKDTTAGRLGYHYSNGPTPYKRFPTYLLPEAFPEGCPTHPSYGAAHATLAGAAVTVLKAVFDGRFQLTNTDDSDPQAKNFVPNYNPNSSDDGTALYRITSGSLFTGLTVNGELNKLASNIAFARSMAGVHWRSDNLWGLLLGERVAIELLREQTQPARDGSVPYYREKHPNPTPGMPSPYARESPFFLIKRFNGEIIKKLFENSK